MYDYKIVRRVHLKGGGDYSPASPRGLSSWRIPLNKNPVLLSYKKISTMSLQSFDHLQIKRFQLLPIHGNNTKHLQNRSEYFLSTIQRFPYIPLHTPPRVNGSAPNRSGNEFFYLLSLWTPLITGSRSSGSNYLHNKCNIDWGMSEGPN